MAPGYALLVLPALLAVETLYFMARWIRTGTAGIKGHQSTKADDPFGYRLTLVACFILFLFSIACSLFIYHLASMPFGAAASLNVIILLINLGMLFFPPRDSDAE